jgi:uncharacterized protein (DUF2141 family)
LRTLLAALLATSLAAVPAQAQRYQQELRHSVVPCQGSGPAVMVNLSGVSASSGTIRAQLYLANADDWLERGRWLNRIELPARAGSMSICIPVPAAGEYAIAIRHDVNDNGETDIRTDGGAMSNNPSINIFNLGRPSINRTRFTIGREVLPMALRMRYL